MQTRTPPRRLRLKRKNGRDSAHNPQLLSDLHGKLTPAREEESKLVEF